MDHTHQNNPCPLFSVIMPTLNRAHVITRAIRSLLKQTFTDFELIIVDDGSSDNTKEVVEGLKEPRLRYIRQEKKGVSAARNAGVALARGRYITFLDSDDEVLPEWLESFANGFDQPQIGIVFVGCTVIEQDGQLRKFDILPKPLGPLFDNQPGRLQAGTFALRRELFEAAGGYAEELVFSENTEFVIRLVAYCKQNGYQIASFAIPLIIYYKHRFDKSRSHTQYKVRLESTEYILTRHADKFQRDPWAHGLFLTIAGLYAVKLEAYDRARRFFFSAILTNPRNWKYYARFFLALIPTLGNSYWMRHNEGDPLG